MTFEERLQEIKFYLDDSIFRALLSDIDKNYISKQKVKEAIKNIPNVSLLEIQQWLWEELNLEDN